MWPPSVCEDAFYRHGFISITFIMQIKKTFLSRQMRHRDSNVIMAVKRIRATVNSREQERLLMDLEVAMRSVDCPYTVSILLFPRGTTIFYCKILQA